MKTVIWKDYNSRLTITNSILKVLKLPLIAAAFLLASQFGLAQGNKVNDAGILLDGTWNSCVTNKYSREFSCVESKNKYEFFDDGTYSETRKKNIEGSLLTTVMGTWSLSGNVLTLKENDSESHKPQSRVKKIKWLNNNLFYFWGREGKHGPKMYTYFQRVSKNQ